MTRLNRYLPGSRIGSPVTYLTRNPILSSTALSPLTTDVTLSTLKQRDIQVSVVDKLNELKEADQTPVCLFPTRKQCEELNSPMLKCLPSEIKVIKSTDDIDQTSTTRKWTNKATEHLEKINQDCNMTAGLESNLQLAVGHVLCYVETLTQKMG